MKFIHKLMELYYYRKAGMCLNMANKRLGSKYAYGWWMDQFGYFWDLYTYHMNKRLGLI